MFVVGLTGGIASGKSTACTEFMELGVPVIDADVMARKVVEPGRKAWHKIRRAFGDDILLADGQVDRDKLGRIVFSDAVQRRKLNSLTHPEIRREMIKQLFFYMLRGYHFAVIDIPLLFESCPPRLLRFFSYIIVIDCPEHVQIERLMARSNYTREEALSRLRSQMPLRDKCELASHVVDNFGTIAETHRQIRKLHELFSRDTRYRKVRFLVLLMFGIWLLIMYSVGRCLLDLFW